MKAAEWIGKTRAENGGNWTPATRIVYWIFNLLVFRALKERVGMRRVRYAGTGAAPIAPEVIEFFMGIGLDIYELYGMTENCAVATTNLPGRNKVGTVGEPYPGIGLRIDVRDRDRAGEDDARGIEARAERGPQFTTGSDIDAQPGLRQRALQMVLGLVLQRARRVGALARQPQPAVLGVVIVVAEAGHVHEPVDLQLRHVEERGARRLGQGQEPTGDGLQQAPLLLLWRQGWWSFPLRQFRQ